MILRNADIRYREEPSKVEGNLLKAADQDDGKQMLGHLLLII